MDSSESSEGKFNSCYLGKTSHYYKQNYNYSNDYDCRHEMIWHWKLRRHPQMVLLSARMTTTDRNTHRGMFVKSWTLTEGCKEKHQSTSIKRHMIRTVSLHVNSKLMAAANLRQTNSCQQGEAVSELCHCGTQSPLPHFYWCSYWICQLTMRLWMLCKYPTCLIINPRISRNLEILIWTAFSEEHLEKDVDLMSGLMSVSFMNLGLKKQEALLSI